MKIYSLEKLPNKQQQKTQSAKKSWVQASFDRMQISLVD